MNKPKIYLYKPTGEKYDLTAAVDGITWSGDYQQVARKLELELLKPVNDRNQNVRIPDTGDMVTLHADGSEVFRGVVWSRDLSESSQFAKMCCYDALIHLTKSETSHNLKGTTPAAATRLVCSEFGIPVGNLTDPQVRYSDAAMGKSPYDIIMTGYTEASKTTGKKYMPRMDGGKLGVIEKGAASVPLVLDTAVNVTNTQYNESLDAMVNKVIVYDDKGAIVNTQQNAEWVALYGILQAAIQYDEKKDNAEAARKALVDMEKKCSVDALGDIRATTGNAIRLRSGHTGLTGLFYIDGDSHTWKNGVHEMNLTLHFQNLMDEKEATEDTSASSSGSTGTGSSKGTGTGTTWEDNWAEDDPHTHGIPDIS